MDAQTLKLIYRGYTFNYAPRPAQPYRQPHALNWRWQAHSENFENAPRPRPTYCKPRTLNWRFQLQSGL